MMKCLSILVFTLTNYCAMSRPMVRRIKSTHEFDRLLEKHATSTGLPVIVDFYSDGCGPCRQIAPAYLQMAKDIGQDSAVFVKVDTNAQYELSSRYNVRSLPTFILFYNGKIHNQMSGAGAQQLQSMVQTVVSKSRRDNILLTKESLQTWYTTVDPSKDDAAITTVYTKCVDMNPKKYNPNKECHGSAATQLVKRLKDKYKSKPETTTRFKAEDRKPDDDTTTKPPKTSSTKRSSEEPNLQLATKEELVAELEKRIEAEEDAAADSEEDDDDSSDFKYGWMPSSFPERVVVIGGGPAGLSAAVYAARAGLKPVVIAPPMGGQLQGKGVDVENYPGVHNATGPAIVHSMRRQAAEFGAVFEDDIVTKINAKTRPFQVYTNTSSVIDTHAIIVATGAESNWLQVPGEYEMRGGGVSSCATCDGNLFKGQDVLVVGGGDTAMEDALVLARTSRSVTVIHRREEFRASKILASRVLDHPLISVKWNTIVQSITGKAMSDTSSNSNNDEDDEDEIQDLDNVSSTGSNEQKFVTGAVLQDVVTGETSKIACSAVFVAIGHTPTTMFLKDVLEFNPHHKGYLLTSSSEKSTQTSIKGIFASGDVSDPIYRQAVTSAGSGAAAALDAERYLSEEGLGNEEAELEAELMAELMADTTNAANADDELGSYNAYEDVGGRVTGMKESVMGVEL